MAINAKYKATNSSCTGLVSDYVASMDWQQLVSLTIVGVAAVLLAGSQFRRRKFEFERRCSCVPVRQASPQSSIVFRARRGERPEVRVRMR